MLALAAVPAAAAPHESLGGFGPDGTAAEPKSKEAKIVVLVASTAAVSQGAS